MFTTQGNLVSSNCSGTLFGFKADPANQVASIRMATRPPIRFYLSSFRICNYKSSPLFRSDKKLDECIGKTHPGGRIQQGAYLHRLSRFSPYFQIIKDRFSFRCLANENLIELRFAESTISVDKNNILSIYEILYTIKLSIKFWSRETIKISFCIRIVNKMDERETETEREREASLKELDEGLDEKFGGQPLDITYSCIQSRIDVCARLRLIAARVWRPWFSIPSHSPTVNRPTLLPSLLSPLPEFPLRRPSIRHHDLHDERNALSLFVSFTNSTTPSYFTALSPLYVGNLTRDDIVSESHPFRYIVDTVRWFLLSRLYRR